MARLWQSFVALALAGCTGGGPVWVHPTLAPNQAADARTLCEARAEQQAGPPAPLPRACGAEISAIARDNCQREADLAYGRLATRLRARETALSACLTEAGFVRQ